MENDRYELGEPAKQALSRYEEKDPYTDWDSIVIAIGKLAVEVNHNSPDNVASGMFVGVYNHHRTIQAMMVNAMIRFLDIYQHSTYDLRNKAAVEAAKKISEFVKKDSIYIPLI